jgi:hypothetical protein
MSDVMRRVCSLDERRDEILQKIAGGLEGRVRGGPNLKDQALALIDGLADELDAEAIAEWKGQVADDWDRINAEAATAQPARLARRKVVVYDELARFREAKRRDVGPQIEAALNASRRADAKVALQVVTARRKEGAEEKPQGFFDADGDADEQGLCLSKAAPFDNALKLISARAWHRKQGIRTLNSGIGPAPTGGKRMTKKSARRYGNT